MGLLYSPKPFTNSKLAVRPSRPAAVALSVRPSRAVVKTQCKAASGAAAQPSLYDVVAKAKQLKDLANANPVLSKGLVEPRRFTGDMGDRLGFSTTTEIKRDGVMWFQRVGLLSILCTSIPRWCNPL